MSDAVRDHRLVAVLALFAIALALFQQGFVGWALLPVLPGLLSLYVGSAIGPPLVLLLLTFVLLVSNSVRGMPAWHRPPPTDLTDFAVAAACVVYVSAHWRLLSLIKQAVPHDARRSRRPSRRRLEGRWLLPAEDAKRTPERVPGTDVFVLIGQGVLFAVAGYLLSVRLTLETPTEDVRIAAPAWRLLLLSWALLLALIAGRSLYAVARWMLAGRDESLVYLQDQLWSATRGEQRRIQAWTTQGRLKEGE